jgi:Mg2+-importing ATPase
MKDLAQAQYWAQAPADIIGALDSSPQGLTAAEAARRLSAQPKKKAEHKFGALDVLLNQFKSPIILLLIFAACLSFYLQEHTDAIVIITIVLISGLLGFWQEYGALNAVGKLLALVQNKVPILRDGQALDVPPDEVVPGDVVRLSAGSTIPADCVVLESKDIFVDEAALTGETFPVEKHAGAVDGSATLAQRVNCLFMGTHVVSGNGTAMVVAVGDQTVFGQISAHLKTKPPESDFERGLAHFGYMLMEITMILVIAIFAVNVFLHRPVLQSFFL